MYIWPKRCSSNGTKAMEWSSSIVVARIANWIVWTAWIPYALLQSQKSRLAQQAYHLTLLWAANQEFTEKFYLQSQNETQRELQALLAYSTQ